MKTATLAPKTEVEVWMRILHPDRDLSPRVARALLGHLPCARTGDVNKPTEGSQPRPVTAGRGLFMHTSLTNFSDRASSI